MKIAWQLRLPWQPYMKKFKWHFLWKYWANFNEISYLGLMWWLYNIKLKRIMIWDSRWPPCSYMVKTILMTSSPEPPGRLGWYFAGSIWGTSYVKKLKSFQLEYKQALTGWGKVGKNDANFPIHEPFELESYSFIGIIKTMFLVLKWSFYENCMATPYMKKINWYFLLNYLANFNEIS